MPLQIIKITSPGDPKIDQICDIFTYAFIGSIPNSAMFPKGPTPALRESFTANERDDLARRKDLCLYCVMDTDAKELIAAGKWRIEDPVMAKAAGEEKKRKPIWSPSEVNQAAVELFMSANDAAHETCMGNEKHMHVKILASAQNHQRRGGATMLMRLVFEQADEAGLRTFLESTIIGKPFYEKMGFEKKADIPLDFRPCGFDAITEQYSMIREPFAPKTSS